MGVFAVGTIADSRLPLRCSTAACEATQVPLTHQWHAVTSTVSVTAAVVSAVAFIIAIFVYRAPRRCGGPGSPSSCCSSSAPCGCSSGSTTRTAVTAGWASRSASNCCR
ncbi:hypothetical protein GS426_14130 [Rhodococcus hoagii]|nr:hypothetical protein [Prescottella equi]